MSSCSIKPALNKTLSQALVQAVTDQHEVDCLDWWKWFLRHNNNFCLSIILRRSDTGSRDTGRSCRENLGLASAHSPERKSGGNKMGSMDYRIFRREIIFENC